MWRNPVASMLIWPSDRVDIIVKPIMKCSLCWPNDLGWITIKPDFYWWGWGGLARVFPGCFFWFDSHIHYWNMAQGWMAKETFGSTILWSGGTWESHLGFGFCIINERLFLLVFLWVFWWIICGLYGCTFIRIYVVIMLVMCVLWQQLCMALSMFLLVNEWIIYLWPNRW